MISKEIKEIRQTMQYMNEKFNKERFTRENKNLGYAKFNRLNLKTTGKSH